MSDGRPGALIIGGDCRGLGIVRSLGRRGIPVWVLTNEHRVAAASRYATFHSAWPRDDDKRKLEYLLSLCDEHKLNRWAIFPTDDEAAAFLARHHAILSARFSMTTAPWEILQWSYDKRLMYAVAARLGIAQPATFLPRSREEVGDAPCGFPAILKPAFKPDLNPFTRSKAWRVDDRQALLSAYDEACRLVHPDIIMVQELIPGDGKDQFSYAALCKNGTPEIAMTARRTRQHPIDFGRASTYVECIEVPQIIDASERLLRAMGSIGLVEIEFKRDPRDGLYKLLDVNSRVWGWHTLGERAGIDFAYLLWQSIYGQPIPHVRARPGVRWVRMLTDLPAAIGEMRCGRLSLTEYMRSLSGPLIFAIFALDDPMPALLDAPLLGLLAWKRRSASTSLEGTNVSGAGSAGSTIEVIRHH